MRVRHWKTIIAGAFAVAALAGPAAADPAQIARDRRPEAWQSVGSDAYDRGYNEGVRRGRDDARDGRRFEYERDDVYRRADRGYDRSRGSLDQYRDWFRRGFATGYREGYERNRVRASGPFDDRRGSINSRRVPGYQEPASARGYSDGYQQGLDDAHDRDRYDPVGHKDYRNGDEGYYREYGSKSAYQDNYRAGFRQGYEEGYRNGRGRR